MIGSNVSVLLDQKNFGVIEENDPRFVANDLFITKNKTTLSKGVFTVCKKTDDDCPPWTLRAKKIIYDKEKKISPKTQRELGLGVHDMKDSHKQVIKQANEPQTWYEWAFGGGKARPDHSHTHI